jgi:SAM-dependent methyltransferase
MAILRCPRCHSSLAAVELESGEACRSINCSNEVCEYAGTGFPVIDGQPVLIDFEASIFDKENFLANYGRSVIARDGLFVTLKQKIRKFGSGQNRVASEYCDRFISAIKAQPGRPRVLVIGGGTVGSGATGLYCDPGIDLVGTDVYLSNRTMLVADAHRLPFSDSSFDGVWIQAVLEHVLDPWAVVSEIHRVLKLSGAVYADTPFMQQVHEGAYDFTRFTLSGHRWLFRKFHHESSGVVGGAGTALIWSIRYFLRALTGSNAVGSLAALAVFWLRFFDRIEKERQGSDAASGVYFFGRKADQEIISPKDMISYYERQLR